MFKHITLILFACLFSLQAQTTTTTSTTTAPCTGSPNTPYSYFGSTGIGYDQFAKLPSLSTAFGVKTGTCSNAFLVTTITTGLGTAASATYQGYAQLSEKFEYHLAHNSYFEFIGDGQIGVVQQGTGTSNTVTSATFGGGAAVGFDIGWLASKGKFHLPIVFHADYVAAPAAPITSAVKPTYLLDIRKTF